MGVRWEPMEMEGASDNITQGLSGVTRLRAQVRGGWLVMIRELGNRSVTFLPDPGHKWDGTPQGNTIARGDPDFAGG